MNEKIVAPKAVKPQPWECKQCETVNDGEKCSHCLRPKEDPGKEDEDSDPLAQMIKTSSMAQHIGPNTNPQDRSD